MNARGYYPATRFPTTDFRAPQRPPAAEPAESFSTCFYQSCPTCGRQLQVDVRYLGRRVYCTHCRCAFVACDEVHGRRYGGRAEARSALERAEQLLALLDSSRRRRAYPA